MTQSPPKSPTGLPDLGTALIQASRTPLVLLDSNMRIVAASLSFCRAFDLSPDHAVGTEFFALGDGEWDDAALRELLSAALAGQDGDDIVLNLVRPTHEPYRLVISARLLPVAVPVRLMLLITDITGTSATQHRLETLLREKDVLHQELQHRVANTLQIIASILIQSARRISTSESSTHLVDAHHRVIAIATLQRQLAASAGQVVVMRSYLHDLCASIAAAIIHDTAKLSLEVTGDDSEAPAELSTSLGLIVTELTINAIKHAFRRDAPSGVIKVDYRASGDGWILTVTDNGSGMSSASITKPGLGTSIINALADKLGARIEIAPAHPGTRVTVTRL